MTLKGSAGDPSATEVQAGDLLHSAYSSYAVQEFIGEGKFGKIAASMNLKTRQNVAVKILKDKKYNRDTEYELHMLKQICDLDCDRTNLVKFHEQFVYMEKVCLVFERLDMTLYDLLQQQKWKHLPLYKIRPVAQQLLVALDALKGHGVLHTDIKPDNIMLVHMKDQPLRVKLIDFGLAIKASKIRQGMYIQPYGYRAPEICLGLKFTEAVDMWSVGCVLGFLYVAHNLFFLHCEYKMMHDMVTLLGQPENRLLRDGKYSRRFFVEVHGDDRSSWRLRTASEFTSFNNRAAKKLASSPKSWTSLSSLIHLHPKLEAAEMEDRRAFVSLLEGLLHLDGDQRLSPRQALQHQFISMSHLSEDFDSSDYLTASQEAMSICPNKDSPHCKTPDSGYTDIVGKISTDCVKAVESLRSSTESQYPIPGVWDSDLSITTDILLPSIEESTTIELSCHSRPTITSPDTTWSSLVNGTTQLSLDHTYPRSSNNLPGKI